MLAVGMCIIVMCEGALAASAWEDGYMRRGNCVNVSNIKSEKPTLKLMGDGERAVSSFSVLCQAEQNDASAAKFRNSVLAERDKEEERIHEVILLLKKESVPDRAALISELALLARGSSARYKVKIEATVTLLEEERKRGKLGLMSIEVAENNYGVCGMYDKAIEVLEEGLKALKDDKVFYDDYAKDQLKTQTRRDAKIRDWEAKIADYRDPASSEERTRRKSVEEMKRFDPYYDPTMSPVACQVVELCRKGKFLEARDRFKAMGDRENAAMCLYRYSLSREKDERMKILCEIEADYSETKQAPAAVLVRILLVCDKGDLKGALKLCSNLKKKYPKSNHIRQAYWRLGVEYIRQGRTDEGISWCEKGESEGLEVDHILSMNSIDLLAWIYLRYGKRDKCNIYLTGIVEKLNDPQYQVMGDESKPPLSFFTRAVVSEEYATMVEKQNFSILDVKLRAQLPELRLP